MHSVFLDLQGLDDRDLAPLRQCCESLTCYPNTPADLVAKRIADAQVVIVNKVCLDAELINNAPHLRLICVAATGTNNVDLAAAKARGVAVFNCQAYGVASVVQHTFALILALSTNLLNYHRSVQQGQWSRASQFCLLDYPITELAGKTLGIIGYGHLGQGVAALGRAFGMQVLIAARLHQQPVPPGRVALAELLPQVDILSLHCPLNDTTRNLIGQAELAQMKPSALLINVARGGIVDEAALLEALERRQIAGAALDVLSQEPPPANHPLLQVQRDNLIITPHCAWGSGEARQRIIAQLAENIRLFQGTSQGGTHGGTESAAAQRRMV